MINDSYIPDEPESEDQEEGYYEENEEDEEDINEGDDRTDDTNDEQSEPIDNQENQNGMNEELLQQQSQLPKNKRRTFTIKDKLKIAEYAKSLNNNRYAAKKYNVEPKQIRLWRSQELQMKELTKREQQTKKGFSGPK